MPETVSRSRRPLARRTRDRLLAGLAAFYLVGGTLALRRLWSGDKRAEVTPLPVDLPMRDTLAPLRPAHSSLTVPLREPRTALASAGPAMRAPVAAGPTASTGSWQAMGKGIWTAAAARRAPPQASAGRGTGFLNAIRTWYAGIAGGVSSGTGGISAPGGSDAARAARGASSGSSVDAPRRVSRSAADRASGMFPKPPVRGLLSPGRTLTAGNPGAARKTGDSTGFVTSGSDGASVAGDGSGSRIADSSAQNPQGATASRHGSGGLSAVPGVGAGVPADSSSAVERALSDRCREAQSSPGGERWKLLYGHDISEPEFWKRRGFTDEDIAKASQNAQVLPIPDGDGNVSLQAVDPSGKVQPFHGADIEAILSACDCAHPTTCLDQVAQ